MHTPTLAPIQAPASRDLGLAEHPELLKLIESARKSLSLCRRPGVPAANASYWDAYLQGLEDLRTGRGFEWFGIEARRLATKPARVARLWTLLDRALETEQFTDSGRIGVEHLKRHLDSLAGARDEHGLPPTLIECSADFCPAREGDFVIEIGNEELLIIGFDRDATAPVANGDNCSVLHGRSQAKEEAPSVPATFGDAS